MDAERDRVVLRGQALHERHTLALEMTISVAWAWSRWRRLTPRSLLETASARVHPPDPHVDEARGGRSELFARDTVVELPETEKPALGENCRSVPIGRDQMLLRARDSGRKAGRA